MPYKNPKDHPPTEEQREKYRIQGREAKRAKYAANPDAQKNASLKYKFKITLEDYDRMLQDQGNGCAICGSLDSGGRGRFHVDHNHSCCPTEKTCGKCIRGLLCSLCNIQLGIIERADWVSKAEAYLRKWMG